MKTREEKKAYSKAYYAAHREERKIYEAARRKERKAYMKTYDAAHREERKAYMKTYDAAHREERKAYDVARRGKRKVNYIAKKFDISLRDAEMLVACRDGEGAWCDICTTTNGPFRIDHDPKTGKIRGILCSRCNLRIEGLDNGFPFEAALRYLA